MPPPEARIADITTRLAAAGLRPQRKQHPRHVTVEAIVPASFPDESWPGVLAALESADWFGLTDNSARGRVLWAAIRTSGPTGPATAGDAPGEPPRIQP
ncbi:hypothetical protein VSR01_19365 [Actinacidiphila sp. DG2A-62]|uniref:hypothetical protein n=1 Tax=Actinacidiphila sp. DG2A-62 TaxID=3108821 RepID=UPI002DB8A870|nr:hypothetical protein [Actinacidiphila sp. DG2A-62]MEC3995569.1 hypothetical protein [Actinacidiphila sp. DG2A-62]